MTGKHLSKPPVVPVSPGRIPEAVSAGLDNGIPVYLIEAGTEEVMRIDFTFDAGQSMDNLPLISSTVNMMLTEGSENYTASRLNRILDFHGTFYNQYSEKDRAGIVIFFMSRHTEKILELSREMLFMPVFPETEFRALMKKRLRWYLVNRDKVSNLAMDQFYESIFGKDHPYGRQVVHSDFNNLNTELLRGFHSRFYSPGKMAIIISGRIHKDIVSLLNRYFGSLRLRSGKTPDKRAGFRQTDVRKVHIAKKGAVQTAIRIGSPSISKLHPDYPGVKVLDVILGGYFNSRLMKNIREEKGLTYGIHSIITSLILSGFKVISTEVSKKSTQIAINEIYKEIEILQRVPVEREELEIVRNFMLGEMVRMFDGPFALAESFRSVWDFGLDNSYYYNLASKIKSIEPDEITALAKTYYRIDDLYQVTAG
ncbi:MAG: pitrilysin family protein [Bacteroidota bacterium]